MSKKNSRKNSRRETPSSDINPQVSPISPVSPASQLASWSTHRKLRALPFSIPERIGLQMVCRVPGESESARETWREGERDKERWNSDLTDVKVKLESPAKQFSRVRIFLSWISMIFPASTQQGTKRFVRLEVQTIISKLFHKDQKFISCQACDLPINSQVGPGQVLGNNWPNFTENDRPTTDRYFSTDLNFISLSKALETFRPTEHLQIQPC